MSSSSIHPICFLWSHRFFTSHVSSFTTSFTHQSHPQNPHHQQFHSCPSCLHTNSNFQRQRATFQPSWGPSLLSWQRWFEKLCWKLSPKQQNWLAHSNNFCKPGKNGIEILKFFPPVKWIVATKNVFTFRSLQQVANLDLHRNNVANVKLPFLHVSTTICCQLWCERRVRRVSHHMIWSFSTTVWPNLTSCCSAVSVPTKILAGCTLSVPCSH